MKKRFLIPIFLCLVSLASLAQTPAQLNSTQLDTLDLYIGTKKKAVATSSPYGYSAHIDSLQKAIGKFKATSPLTRLFMPTHSASSFGTTTLVAGTKTVTNSAVTANSKISVFLITPGGTIGAARYVSTITAGTSFVIKSIQANSTDQTSDTSVVGYLITN